MTDVTISAMKFEFKEKGHKYTLDGKPLTGVTTILGVIAKPALIDWAANTAVDYVENEMPVIGSKWEGCICENTDETCDGCEENRMIEATVDWQKLNSILVEAREAHTRKRDDAGKKGTDVHKEIEVVVKGAIKNFDGYIQGSIGGENKQIRLFCNWATENKVKFLDSEKRMYSEKLWFAGTVDAVAEIRGNKYVVDFKTQAKLWDRTPFLQVAGYRIMLEEMGETGYHGGLVVLLPKEGGMETHYSYEYESDKEGFLAALKIYRIIKNKTK